MERRLICESFCKSRTLFSSSRRLMPPPALAPRVDKINPAQQQRQFLRADREFCSLIHCLRPTEPPPLQPGRTHPQAVPIPYQHLQSRPWPVAKKEEVPRKRVRLQTLLHQAVQPIESLAHIRRPHRQIHPRGCSYAKHQRPSCLLNTATITRNSSARNPRLILSRSPPVNSISKSPLG